MFAGTKISSTNKTNDGSGRPLCNVTPLAQLTAWTMGTKRASGISHELLVDAARADPPAATAQCLHIVFSAHKDYILRIDNHLSTYVEM